ncbi:MAG TPA: aminotransferase class IV [Amycolatopsis sp.]|uniref:aminotransferase class IV n=1 Tax=Amycolatopsis sp. TaxID=37632 RepID=UPI002B467048|nr:aminotransferase class IV [Amycolatopsis sp.]HKS49166.1 aminotransferase class IV [Amycolatopsis sp.]
MSGESGSLLVADSWLLVDGAVRAMEKHIDRFTRSCLELGVVSAGELREFWSTVVAGLPRSGTWFPRVELVDAAPALRLRIRPAPVLRESVRIWVPDEPDRRSYPHRKGPDLDRLALLREDAERYGAHEALLTTSDGFVVEGASSSLLWWEEGVLCEPPADVPALPGTTAAVVRELASARGIRTARRARRPEELGGREVWLVNALHGVRLVTGWTPGAIVAGPGARFRQWRALVENLRVPLKTFPLDWADRLPVFL